MEPPSPTTPDPGARLARLRDALGELRRRSVIDASPLANWRASSAVAGAAEIAEGDPGPAGDPVVFERHTVTIPAEWPLEATRLDLDALSPGHVRLHSRLGQGRHPVGPDAAWVPVPTRAFGIRVEAHRTAPSGAPTSGAPRLGGTRLVRLDPARAAMHARLSAELQAIDGARSKRVDTGLIAAWLAAIESALVAALGAALGAARASAPAAVRAS